MGGAWRQNCVQNFGRKAAGKRQFDSNIEQDRNKIYLKGVCDRVCGGWIPGAC
jgi:hypothetical protein